jgi:hypothetical protein
MESIKQTAVKWLQEAISKKLSSEIGPYFLDLFDQAKEIEKEQIEDAYDIGFADAWDDARYDDEPKYAGSEHYYNKTYGGNK